MSEEYIRDLQMQARAVDKVLKDIKTEISKYDAFYHGTSYANGLHKAIEIIDKHISEADKDGD